MCHAEPPAGGVGSPTVSQPVTVPLPGGEHLPAAWITGERVGAAVLLLSDMYGPSPFYQHLAAALASRGYGVLLPDYFFRQGTLDELTPGRAFARRAGLDEVQSLADAEAALGWLSRYQPGHRIGVLGFCMAGTFALDLASTRPDLVTVAYYGFPVPQASIKSPPPRPVDLAGSLRGPVLAFWGDQDQAVGLEQVADYAARASRANPEFSHELVPGLDHGFLAHARLDDPSDPAGATWQRALGHFHRHLLTRDIDQQGEARRHA
jgi:carboxymethylenebutenolidase